MKHTFVFSEKEGIKIYKVHCYMNQGYDYEIETVNGNQWDEVCPMCKQKINFNSEN